jgi:hypothetical protein
MAKLRRRGDGSYELDLREYDDFWLGVYISQYFRRFRSGDVVELIFDDLSVEEGAITALQEWGYRVLERSQRGKDVHLLVEKI